MNFWDTVYALEIGISVDNHHINTIQYAGDKAVVANESERITTING